ncbi:MAG: class I SAM-dependent methyltransferase [Candidatus Thorarchaeota archaeon]|nr:MAG: class I SAM-dependent methyltransferase [Candidatus Thorarchaeota archaeon]
MNAYYSKKLSSNNLKRCYDIAPLRVQQYLKSEMGYVLENISCSDYTLELGCGYGRVLEKILPFTSEVIGIDIAQESLKLASEYIGNNQRCHLILANAKKLPFPDKSIDKVVCIQNGISAFKIDPQELVQETLRVTKEGGVCMFSSYSPKFWKHRLDWFQKQADAGLIGKIDWSETKDGVISCKDGFKATTFTLEDFTELIEQLELEATIVEVDASSVFCKIVVK